MSDSSENLSAAGTMHASKYKADTCHVKQLTSKLMEMATYLENNELFARLSCGDLVSNEIYYYKSKVKSCYQDFVNSYHKKKSEEVKDDAQNYTDWIKAVAFNKIVTHQDGHQFHFTHFQGFQG